MNKFYLIVLFLLSFIRYSNAENIVNGSFESWQTTPTLKPTNWYTSNVLTSDTVINKDTDHHGTGSFSAKLSVTANGNIPTLSSTETSGSLDTVAIAYQYLNFWYKTSLL